MARKPECIKPISSTAPDAEPCVWGTGSTNDIYLAGDSNAEHFIEPVVKAAVEIGSRVTSLIATGCPLALFVVQVDNQSGSSDGTADATVCEASVEGRLAWLEKRDAGLVILSQAEIYRRSDDYLIGDSIATATRDPAAKSAFIRKGVLGAVARLRTAGHRVLLVDTVPTFWSEATDRQWLPQSCSLRALADRSCAASARLATLTASQAEGRDDNRLARKLLGADVLNLDERLCPHGFCETQTGDMIQYLDGSHLSILGSSALTSEFRDAIRRSFELPAASS